MVEAEYFIFCAAVSQDERGRNLIGAFDMIVSQSFPTRHEPFVAQVLLRAKKAIVGRDMKVRIAIERDGETVSDNNTLLAKVMAEKDSTVELNLNFREVVFEKPGRYYFNIFIDDKPAISRILRVRAASDFTEA